MSQRVRCTPQQLYPLVIIPWYPWNRIRHGPHVLPGRRDEDIVSSHAGNQTQVLSIYGGLRWHSWKVLG